MNQPSGWCGNLHVYRQSRIIREIATPVCELARDDSILKEENPMTVKSKSEKLGQGVGFERIRRITGYLVGTMDKWNDAKRAEERDRVKHSLNGNA